jgi:o-succinylbenzoate synthase
MIFSEIKYKKFHFNLANPIKTSGNSITQREVLIIKAISKSNGIFLGEVSPLPGFSKESINDCEKKLSELSKDGNIVLDKIKTFSKECVEYPSLLFGLQQIIFSAESGIDKNFPKQKSINLNALVGINNETETLKRISEFVEQGFGTIKLKIGRHKFEDDYNIIEKINYEFGSKIKLRLDNNGSWDIKNAVEYVKRLSKFNIQYFEQPVHNIKDLLYLAKISEISIAADESVVNYNDAKNIIESDLIKFIVLKPSIRLGLFDSLRIIELANKANVSAIITTSFETAVARSSLLYLASTANHNLAHGLGINPIGGDLIKSNINYEIHTLNFFETDLISIPEVNF